MTTKEIESEVSPTSHQYRFDTAKEFSANLKTLSEQYRVKIKKYRRKITAIDAVVYSVSGIVAGAGVILSTVTTIAPIAVPIAVSAMTTIAGVANAITKKISSCFQKKLNEYTVKHQIVSDAYSKLSGLISLSIDNLFVSDVEFSTMVQLYSSAMSKIEDFQLEAGTTWLLKLDTKNNE